MPFPSSKRSSCPNSNRILLDWRGLSQTHTAEGQSGSTVSLMPQWLSSISRLLMRTKEARQICVFFPHPQQSLWETMRLSSASILNIGDQVEQKFHFLALFCLTQKSVRHIRTIVFHIFSQVFRGARPLAEHLAYIISFNIHHKRFNLYY